MKSLDIYTFFFFFSSFALKKMKLFLVDNHDTKL